MAPSAAATQISSHSISQLTYRLFQGRVDLAPLQIRESRRVEWAGYQVTLHVLGASHAVELEGNGCVITETLTCGPIHSGSYTVAEFQATAVSEFRSIAGDFQVTARCESFELDGHWKAPIEFCGPLALRVRFELQGPQHAETAIRWWSDRTLLIIETIHTYPEEGRGVRSHSVFEALNAASR